MNTKTNTKVQNETNELQEATMKLADTSKKIRFLISQAPEGTSPVAFAYNQLKKFGVTTKNGGEIRYQHVRNVAITPIKS